MNIKIREEEVYNEFNDTKLEKTFKLDIEQLDITQDIITDISEKIKSEFTDKEHANLVIQYASVYVRIYNLLSYLKNNFLNKEDTIEKLLQLKAEIKYLQNDIYDNYRKDFLCCVDKKSNLHQINKLDDCIDELLNIVKKHRN